LGSNGGGSVSGVNVKGGVINKINEDNLVLLQENMILKEEISALHDRVNLLEISQYKTLDSVQTILPELKSIIHNEVKDGLLYESKRLDLLCENNANVIKDQVLSELKLKSDTVTATDALGTNKLENVDIQNLPDLYNKLINIQHTAQVNSENIESIKIILEIIKLKLGIS
jgi:hypothetical protein